MTSPSAVPPCTVAELAERRERGDHIVVIDVREAEELAIAALPDVVHIPLGMLSRRLAELEDFRESEIVVMCHHGMRSAHGCGILRRSGFAHVRNLSGGIDAYAREVDSSVPRY